MKPFFDTNVLVYGLQTSAKSEIARTLIGKGGVISVQVLNELTSVAHRKLGRSWADIERHVALYRGILSPVRALTVNIHTAAILLARDHQFSFYDALIVASAASAGCDILYTEDMQHGREIGPVTIHNPFRSDP